MELGSAHAMNENGSPFTSRRNRPLLFALTDVGLPTSGLLQSLALAGALEARLHVLRVVFGRWPMHAPTAQIDLLAMTRSGEYALASDRKLRAWLAGVSSASWRPDEVCTRSGDFVKQVAERAATIDASLIVLPAFEGRLGEVATLLACAAQRPVLVARQARFEESIVAATDLGDATYPVLRTATSLGRRLDAPVVAVHNVSPLLAGPGPVVPVGADTSRSLVGARRQQLELALRCVGSQTPPAVVAERDDAVEAILGEAARRNVGLIAVGARPRSWLQRLLSTSVPCRVVNGTERSVLVVPMTGRRQPKPASPRS